MSATDPLSHAEAVQELPSRAPAHSSASHSGFGALADLVVRGSVQLENALYEYKLGIRTRGLYNWTPANWNESEHVYYGSTLYRRIFRILDALQLGKADTFVDLGCGKGRVACCASRYPLAEVIGIEDVPELCQMARTNLASLRSRRAQATILNAKAEDFAFASGTVIYMFHPFGPKTLSAVLSRLRQGTTDNPRQVRIVYVNPVHERVLGQTDWLEMYDRWPARRRLWTEIMHAVSFWKLRGR